MTIRPASPQDASALARLHIDSWRAAYCRFVPADYLARLDHQKRTKRFVEIFTAGPDETYVIEDGNDIPGFLTIGQCRDVDMDPLETGEIWGIYLSPRFWRKGIGTLLCRYGEEKLFSRGCKQITLWVFEANADARSFYEAMGFKLEGASQTLNVGIPLQAIRYIKTKKELPENG
ncbi:MAG: GNAT family N-acetyltransferase [FCB group bacterium]|nr:GNAT family N-acetyltransferase [FCB group bacterium]